MICCQMSRGLAFVSNRQAHCASLRSDGADLGAKSSGILGLLALQVRLLLELVPDLVDRVQEDPWQHLQQRPLEFHLAFQHLREEL